MMFAAYHDWLVDNKREILKLTSVDIVIGAVLLLSGIIGIFSPKKIQEYTLKRYSIDKDPKGLEKLVSKIPPSEKYLNSSLYVVILRITGVFAITVLLFLIYATLHLK